MKNTKWQLLCWFLWCALAWTVIVLVVYEEYFTAIWFGVATIIFLVVLVAWGLIYSYEDKQRLDQLFEDKLK